MGIHAEGDWSPADNPYAIAVPEVQWWAAAVRLAVARLDDDEDQRGAPFSSRQLDARGLVLVLAQLLTAEHLEQMALADLQIEPSVGRALTAARESFEEALPNLQSMRDALTHFDNWSRGEGFGTQRRLAQAGAARRDIASDYWGFRFDSQRRRIELGQLSIDVGSVRPTVDKLARAIYAAAAAVDDREQLMEP